MKYLVTGGSGQVGFELTQQLRALGDVVAPRRSELDLASPDSIRAAIDRVRPDVIVNAAAYTAVDRAESERDACFDVNARAPGLLAEEARRIDAALIHFSTDYVFDGTKAAPYVECDDARPLNVYGESKLAGERAVESVGGAWLILRTSWVYGLRGQNFLRTILRRAREADELRVVDDQIGAPTWSRSLAAATARLLASRASESLADRIRDVAGVYHLTSAGSASWFEFARAILDVDGGMDRRPVRLVPIPTAEYPTPARRPAWSVLDCTKSAHVLGVRLGSWEAELTIAFASSSESGVAR